MCVVMDIQDKEHLSRLLWWIWVIHYDAASI